MESKNSELVMAQATRWYARLRAPDCNEAERQAFQDWLAQDAVHARAYRQTEILAERVTQQLRTDPRLQALAAKALVATPTVAKQPIYKTSWRVAAALLLGAGVAALFATRHSAQQSDVVAVATYSNTQAQQQRIELADGSVVYLDVSGQLNVQMSKAERRLELLKGRAYFEVAHDATRPFSVGAGGARTVALGTRFEVALAAQNVSVTLAEGSVAINNTADTDNWREILRPGQQLKFNASTGARQKLDVDAAAVTSWSRGRLVFDGTPLANALDEINRYAAVKIHLGDETLAAVPIGGNFVAGGDSEQVVDALAAVLPLRIVHVGANEIVLFQRYETALN